MYDNELDVRPDIRPTRFIAKVTVVLMLLMMMVIPVGFALDFTGLTDGLMEPGSKSAILIANIGFVWGPPLIAMIGMFTFSITLLGYMLYYVMSGQRHFLD